jgi:hypothetical protein
VKIRGVGGTVEREQGFVNRFVLHEGEMKPPVSADNASPHENQFSATPMKI